MEIAKCPKCNYNAQVTTTVNEHDELLGASVRCKRCKICESGKDQESAYKRFLQRNSK